MSKLALELIEKEKQERTGVLDLGNCGLTELPEELFELVWLEKLNICNCYWDYQKGQKIKSSNNGKRNQIVRFPNSIRKLKKLKIIRLSEYIKISNICYEKSYNTLSELEIQYLHLRTSQFCNLSILKNLTSVEVLSINSKKIKSLKFLKKLKNIKLLSLFDNQVSDIQFLKNLTNIRFLDLSFNRIKDIQTLNNLNQIKHLNISNNKIINIHPLSDLKELESLDLSNNILLNIQPLSKLVKLKNLSLNNNYIEEIKVVNKFPNLEILNLHNNKISSLKLSNFESLKSLKVSGNLIKNVLLKNLTKIKYIDLNNQIINNLNLKKLPHLSELSLNNNRLSNPILTELKSLKYLIIKSNYLSNLLFLHDLKTLEVIDVKYNAITQVRMIDFIHLKHLRVNGNPIKSIKLKNLLLIKNLDLGYLHIENISIENLPQLKSINLAHNKISNLKGILPLIKNNKIEISLTKNDYDYKINLFNNPIQQPPIEIVQQGNAAILNYFQERETQDEVELYEAKLLIIGEGGVGKSSLMTKLMDENNALPGKEDTTKGIDIQEYHFTTKAGQDFRINIWDFGGQEIYHATHQFFLTKRSLYVLVDDTRKDDKTVHDATFNYWLQMVELFGGESPVVIVQNEKGDRSKQLDLKSIQSRFSNVKGTYVTNLLTCRDLSKTKAALEHFIQELPIVGQKLPKQWVAIRNALEDLEREGTPYISLEKYYAVCADHTIPEEDRALFLSQFLHDLGVFLHFQEDDLLRKYVILKNEWATDAVYKVLDCESVKQANGRFNRKDLQMIWGGEDCREKYKNMHGELLALMRNFELCYQLQTPKHTYIAPQLFPESRPDYAWDEAGNLILQYRYRFMPKGLLSRFVVRMHRYVQNLETAWKNGVILQKGDTQAEVVNLYARQILQIRVRGTENKVFLDIIREEFERIHDLYEGIRVNAFIPCNCDLCSTVASSQKYYFKGDFLKNAYRNNSDVQCQESLKMVNVHRLVNDTFMAEKMEDLRRTKADYVRLKQEHLGSGDNVGGGKTVNITNNYGDSKSTKSSLFIQKPKRQPIDKEEVRNLVVENELGEVFDILIEKAQSEQLKSDILLQKARWREKKREKRNGVISGEAFDLAIARVRQTVLEWVGEW